MKQKPQLSILTILRSVFPYFYFLTYIRLWLLYIFRKIRNVYLTYNGKTQTMKQWSEDLNISYNTIICRHRKGWKDKECLFGKGGVKLWKL